MISIFAPGWFTRFDILIEVFSFLVLLTFFIISIKNYKLIKNKKLLYLGIGFLLIAVAELSTILTKFVIYYKTNLQQVMGDIIIKYSVLHQSDLPYDIGFFLYKFLTLAGLYMIYRLPLKNKNVGDILLGIFFLVLSALAGQSIYYIFHITVIIMLLLIINNYLKIYEENKNNNTKLLIIAFGILTLGNMFLILSSFIWAYVVGQILQLVSYVLLLGLVININKNGRSKRK